VRYLLSKAFDDERLGRFAQISSVRQRVTDADGRLKGAVLPDVEIGGADKPWWRRGVLVAAGVRHRC
jgi:hypothetical protein